VGIIHPPSLARRQKALKARQREAKARKRIARAESVARAASVERQTAKSCGTT